MKVDLKNIKKLTGQPNYKVVWSFDHVHEKIQDYIDNLGLEITPDFQRGHVWTKNQQIKFIEFILKGGKSLPIIFNHPNWMNSFKGDFVLVDGKQRLNAINNFFDGKIKVFGAYIHELENFYPNSFDIEIWVNTLKTREEVLNWYLELNSGGTPHSKKELDKVKELLEKNNKTKSENELISFNELKKNTNYYLTGEFWDGGSCMIGTKVQLVRFENKNSELAKKNPKHAIVKTDDGEKIRVFTTLFKSFN